MFILILNVMGKLVTMTMPSFCPLRVWCQDRRRHWLLPHNWRCSLPGSTLV